MPQARKITYCPCGQPSIGFRQGIQCCPGCEKIESGYWTGAAATTSRLHGVSRLQVDSRIRAGHGDFPQFQESDESAAAERKARIQGHLDRIVARLEAEECP